MRKLFVLVGLAMLFPVLGSAQMADLPGPSFIATTSSGESGGRSMNFGAGVHYMKTVGDIQDTPEFQSDALNLLVAGRKGLGLITLELDSEWALDYGGSSKTLWLPQAFGLIGGMIYGGAGIGTGLIDGEWFDRPIYTLRAGVNLPLGFGTVDVNANYQFMNSKALEGISSEDLDSVTIGAVLWF